MRFVRFENVNKSNTYIVTRQRAASKIARDFALTRLPHFWYSDFFVLHKRFFFFLPSTAVQEVERLTVSLEHYTRNFINL